MAVLEDILTHAKAEAEAGKWADVVTKLKALETSTPNPRHWTLGDIQGHFGELGMTIAGKIAGAVKAVAKSEAPEAALFESIFVALSTTGIQLHTPARQAMIDMLGAAFSPEEVAAVKGLGLTVTKVYPDVTEASVEETYSLYKRAQTLNNLQQQFDAIKNMVGTVENANAAALLRAMANEIEGV